MAAYPAPPLHLPSQPQLLTVSDYLALPEDGDSRYELMEGVLVMSPSPRPRHNRAALRLAMLLEPQMPDHLAVVFDVDVDLDLAPPDKPGTVRRPDVLVYDKTAGHRVDEEGGSLTASDLTLAVEIVSPGSRRVDNVMKRSEYQDAGIPHYWIVDLDEPVSLLACQLTDDAGYVETAKATGTYTATEPFPVTVGLDGLH